MIIKNEYEKIKCKNSKYLGANFSTANLKIIIWFVYNSFRWATDRVGKKGIIGFVNKWIHLLIVKIIDGFRKVFIWWI